MRKVLSLIIAIMSIVLFAGCGGNKDAKDNNSGKAVSSTAQQSETPKTPEEALSKFGVKGKVICL